MFRIGEFSKLCKTSIKTLRYYDEVDLLKPEYIDQETNYRFYTTDQLVEYHLIQSYRQIGLSIDEIKLILLGRNEESILESRKQELLSLQETITEQLLRIKFIESGADDEKYMNYHAVMKELPSCIVYSKKLILPDYNSYFNIIPAIGESVMQLNPDMKCTTPEYCFTIYPDGEYRETNINIEFCEAVDRMGICPEGVEFKKMESITSVSVMHKGPYHKLNLAYAYVFKWIENNDYIVIDSPRESYIDGVWNKESEEEWLTELQIPVIKKTNEKERKNV